MAGLGDILGGLVTVGAQGAGGGLEGLVKGEEARRKFISEDFSNQLKQMEMVLKGQQFAQGQVPQATHIGNGMVMVRDPMTGMVSYERGPQDPATVALNEARTKQANARAGYYDVRAQHAGDPKAAPPRTMDHVKADIAEKVRAGGIDALAPGERAIWGLMQQTQQRTPSPHINVRPVRDAQGNVRNVVTQVNPVDGSVRTTVEPLGPIGMPQRQPAGAGGLVPRETITQTTRIIPGKPIKGDSQEYAGLTKALPDIVNAIAANPAIQGWMQPGPLVRVEGYPAPVRREDVIRHAMRRRFGVDVGVRWDGRQWVLMNAREATQREPIETRRTVGPPSQQDAESDDDERD